jgi:hypothetical protein
MPFSLGEMIIIVLILCAICWTIGYLRGKK